MVTEDKNVDEAKVELSSAELQERLKRMQADFDNFRKRTEKERGEVVAAASSGLIGQLLPVLDNFELSLKYSDDVGVKMIHAELLKVLQRQGLSIIDTKGDFDAKIHEAVGTVPGKKDGAIAEVVQKGYLLNDKLLRASKVKIVGN